MSCTFYLWVVNDLGPHYNFRKKGSFSHSHILFFIKRATTLGYRVNRISEWFAKYDPEKIITFYETEAPNLWRPIKKVYEIETFYIFYHVVVWKKLIIFKNYIPEKNFWKQKIFEKKICFLKSPFFL